MTIQLKVSSTTGLIPVSFCTSQKPLFSDEPVITLAKASLPSGVLSPLRI